MTDSIRKLPPHLSGTPAPVPVEADRQAGRRPEAGAPAPEPVVEVYDRYEHVLTRLPGVTGVRADEAGLCIQTRAARDGKFLDQLLENEIDGIPLRFEETGPASEARARKPARPAGEKKPRPVGAKKPPRPPLSPAERVLRRYGKALKSMPHVTDVAVASPGSPGSAPGALSVRVDQADAVGYMQDLVEDSVLGVLVSFETA